MRFELIDFLKSLIDDVAVFGRGKKFFSADPDILGPLLIAARDEFTLLLARYEALVDNDWAVSKQWIDGKWRVYLADTDREYLDGQLDGFDSAGEALDAAILGQFGISGQSLAGDDQSQNSG